MFRKAERTGPELLATQRGRRRFEARFIQATLHLSKSPENTSVHIVTATEDAAWAQVTAVAELSTELDVPVARLRAADSAEQRAEAYRATVVVGTRADFAADLGREAALGISRQAAIIEGSRAEAADLHAAYPKSYRG